MGNCNNCNCLSQNKKPPHLELNVDVDLGRDSGQRFDYFPPDANVLLTGNNLQEDDGEEYEDSMINIPSTRKKTYESPVPKIYNPKDISYNKGPGMPNTLFEEESDSNFLHFSPPSGTNKLILNSAQKTNDDTIQKSSDLDTTSKSERPAFKKSKSIVNSTFKVKKFDLTTVEPTTVFEFEKSAFLIAQSDPDRSLDYLKSALNRRFEDPDVNGAQIGRLYLLLGLKYGNEKHDYSFGLDQVSRGISYLDKYDEQTLGFALEVQAYFLLALGKSEEAEKKMSDFLARSKKLNELDHVETASGYVGMGIIQKQQMNLKDSIGNFLKAEQTLINMSHQVKDNDTSFELSLKIEDIKKLTPRDNHEGTIDLVKYSIQTIRSLLKPNLAQVYMYLGECYTKLKQNKKALQMLNKLFGQIKDDCVNELSFILMHNNYSQQVRELYEINPGIKEKSEKLISYYYNQKDLMEPANTH